MLIATVKGTVVGTQRSDEIDGATFLLVAVCDGTLQSTNNYIVALDAVGAGRGELVLLSQGSSARQTAASYEKPIDAIIVGIIDVVTERGEVVFRK